MQALARGLRAVGLEDARLGLDDLGERPEREPGAVRQAPPLAPDDRLRALRREALELDEQAGLADTRVADERHCLERPVGASSVEHVSQVREVVVAAEDGRLGAASQLALGSGHERERLPRVDGDALALRHHGLERLVLHGVLGGPAGCRPDDDRSGPCLLLEPGGGVDDVSGDRRLTAARVGGEVEQYLTRRDADAHSEVLSALGVVDVLDRAARGEGRSQRALGVVLMGDRRAEDAEDRIADELLHRAAETLELRADAAVVRRQ